MRGRQDRVLSHLLEDQAQAQGLVLSLGIHPATSTHKVFTVRYVGCNDQLQFPCTADTSTRTTALPHVFRFSRSCNPRASVSSVYFPLYTTAQASDDLTKTVKGVLSTLQQRAQGGVLRRQHSARLLRSKRQGSYRTRIRSSKLTDNRYVLEEYQIKWKLYTSIKRLSVPGSQGASRNFSISPPAKPTTIAGPLPAIHFSESVKTTLVGVCSLGEHSIPLIRPTGAYTTSTPRPPVIFKTSFCQPSFI